MKHTDIYNQNDIEILAQKLKDGKLIAFPTETVYGLGASIFDNDALKKVFKVKKRPLDNPLNITIGSLSMMNPYVKHINEIGKVLINHYWPGPLTLIFSIIPGSLSNLITAGLSTAAFRMPSNKVTLKLINRLGFPIVGPSANLSGRPSPTQIKHVLHDMDGKIDGILDDGSNNDGIESTILDLTGNIPEIIRPGIISKVQIEDLLECKINIRNSNVQNKYLHYKPNTNVFMINNDNLEKIYERINNSNMNNVIGIMATSNVLNHIHSDHVIKYDLGKDVLSASKRFFSGLRYLDEIKNINMILAQTFSDNGIGAAYMNRLRKASQNKYITY